MSPGASFTSDGFWYEGSALLADRTLPVLRTGSGANRLQVAVNAMSYVGAHTQPAQLEI